MEGESVEGNSLAAYMVEPIFKKQKVESIEGKPMRWFLQEVLSLIRVLEAESKLGNSLAADMLERLKQVMEGESIKGTSVAAGMLEHLIQKMEHTRIDGLAADMSKLSESTKAAQEAHSDNKNEEVAEPELDRDNNYGSTKLVDLASFDHAHFKYMPCYDNIVLLDLDERN